MKQILKTSIIASLAYPQQQVRRSGATRERRIDLGFGERREKGGKVRAVILISSLYMAKLPLYG